MNDNGLNLARKWRSKQFDELVGQKLVVRTVKNSLYRNLIFPVYLFSGTKGCGKTSMARLFAAALNCQELETFRKNPQKIVLPCLVCFSCTSMQKVQHPDFIEIDAASHTGVDNVRQIIDAASFVPVLGSKKIYLIDEAHMLSKAAFNALLKVLEEPPSSALFILATTDPHKVLDTVRSRCFQLFFHPISQTELIAHLTYICQQEKISFDLLSLELIAHVAEGSMRDALNIIERVRLVHPALSKQGVIEILGAIDDEQLVRLFKKVLGGDPTEVLRLIAQLQLERYNTQIVWRKYVDLLRASLWLKQGIELSTMSSIKEHILSCIGLCSLDKLIQMVELCYAYELTLAKTSAPHMVFEMVLLKMCQLHEGQRLSRTGESIQSIKKQEVIETSEWPLFLQKIEKLDDPLVTSIFKQGTFVKWDTDTRKVEVSFSQDLLFFKEWLQTTQKLWQPVLEESFKSTVELDAQFTGAMVPAVPKPVISMKPLQPKQPPISKPQVFSSQAQARTFKEKEVALSISDKGKWPRASTILRIFPGTITYKASS